jgi:hypothetical protein
MMWWKLPMWIVILLAAGAAFKGAGSLAEQHYEPKTWIIVTLVIGAVLAVAWAERDRLRRLWRK